MKAKLLMFFFAALALAALISLPGWACNDACHSKCAEAFPQNWSQYQACMVGCCPAAY